MQNCVFRAIVCVFLIASGRDAAAQGWQWDQPWTDRGYLNLNVGFESVSGQLNDATTRSIYGEAASLSVQQAIDSGSFFDFSAGARVWRNVSVGIAFHSGDTNSESSLQTSSPGGPGVPHPYNFRTPRPLELTATGLDRSERAVHLQFGYMLPLSERLSVHVTLGPSFFTLHQDVIDDLELQEVGGDFTTVNGTPIIAERDDSPTGFNIGADVTYNAYTRDRIKVGGGMFVRYSGASADVQVLDNVVDSDVGGLQVGFGGRIRF